MRQLLISGGNPLQGKVKISGAKNAALPIITASLLTSGESTIYNVPYLNDVITMLRVLRALGARAEYVEPNGVRIWMNHTLRHVAPYELVTKMRASFFVMGPLLARMGLAKVPLPGGCAIGSRPVDIHVKGFRALGAEVSMEHGFVVASAPRLRGGRVYLDFPSVGATESILMAATLAEGETVIENAAREPEIEDLARYLTLAGARIEGAGSETIHVVGVTSLSGIEYHIIPDRVETSTFLLAGAITQGKVTVEGAVPHQVESVLEKLREAGFTVNGGGDIIELTSHGRPRAVNLKTLPYPGFPTDVQPQFTSLLALADGTSIVTETVFENRFMHLQELRRMGASLTLEGRNVIIRGVPQLSSAPVRVHDLRGGAALLLAALATKGETLVVDTDRHLERGYEKLAEKLGLLGAKVLEVK